MKPSWMQEDEQKAAERKVRVLAMMSQANDMEKEIRLREKISYTLTADELYHLLNNYHWRKERLINATDNSKLQGTEK